MQIVQAPTAQQMVDDGGSTLRLKVVEIGDWNMDTTTEKYVAHGLSKDVIIAVNVMIRSDTGSAFNNIPMAGGMDVAAIDGGIFQIDDTYVKLTATAAGGFDSPDFDATSYNRGWVYIWYTI